MPPRGWTCCAARKGLPGSAASRPPAKLFPGGSHRDGYIGQSVNIQDRFKQHVKCGLGIDASATNKLYKAMQQDGVWNFSFELMEECSRTELNEKEKFWIQMYQSDIYGYNSTSGNK